MGGKKEHEEDFQNREDYEAYMKWCEERKMAMQEQERQQEMMKEFQKAEEKRQMEMEKARVHKEIEERRESMMAQWKMWQMRLSQQHEFDNLMGKFEEMKHEHNSDWDLDDLDGIDSTNAVEVARVLATRPAADRVKAFYGGLASSMCLGARAYVEQVRKWEADY